MTTEQQTTTSQDVHVRDDAKLILDQVRDAISEIEGQAAEIDDCMTELCGLDDLPDGVADMADGLQLDAGDLSDVALILGNHLERLDKVLAAGTDDESNNNDSND